MTLCYFCHYLRHVWYYDIFWRNSILKKKLSSNQFFGGRHPFEKKHISEVNFRLLHSRFPARNWMIRIFWKLQHTLASPWLVSDICCLPFIFSLRNQIPPSERLTRIDLLWKFLTFVYEAWNCSISGLWHSSIECSFS